MGPSPSPRTWSHVAGRGTLSYWMRRIGGGSGTTDFWASRAAGTRFGGRAVAGADFSTRSGRRKRSSGKGRAASSPSSSSGEVPEAPIAANVIDTELHVEASKSYLAYALSVIVGRALPDARDGLKPVHRRILFAMNELGLAPSKPYRKSARVVGEVLGKFHPHGDQAVYDSMVRMAQTFSLRHMLIQGHGNFGSQDDDPPAAMRYTESRLSEFSVQTLLQDLDRSTVDFIPNFDVSTKEPTVLPARVPNLLVNGAQGIAVGVATNIPPHNLNEIVSGLVAYIDNPDISTKDLMKSIPAPDFPTGGLIVSGDSKLRHVYEKGSGRVVIRSKTHVEDQLARKGRQSIIVTEIPYQVSKSGVIEQIAEMVDAGKIQGITDIRDESDRDGMRIVIDVQRRCVTSLTENILPRPRQSRLTILVVSCSFSRSPATIPPSC